MLEMLFKNFAFYLERILQEVYYMNADPNWLLDFEICFCSLLTIYLFISIFAIIHNGRNAKIAPPYPEDILGSSQSDD